MPITDVHDQLVSNFSIEKAHAAQLKIFQRVVKEDTLPRKIQYVGGVDVAYTGDQSIGAVAVIDYNSLSVIEFKTSCLKTKFPYIPALLAFRETPPIISAIKKLHSQPDIFLVDGHGIMHPYRLGLASHLGVILGKPTIGVAKNPLIGKPNEQNVQEDWTPMIDNNETVGARLTNKKGSKPIYVSIGHMISLSKAIEVVKQCTSNHRIPEPLRQAHNKAQEIKSTLHQSNPYSF